MFQICGWEWWTGHFVTYLPLPTTDLNHNQGLTWDADVSGRGIQSDRFRAVQSVLVECPALGKVIDNLGVVFR